MADCIHWYFTFLTDSQNHFGTSRSPVIVRVDPNLLPVEEPRTAPGCIQKNIRRISMRFASANFPTPNALSTL
jgi:hypothetical protein